MSMMNEETADITFNFFSEYTNKGISFFICDICNYVCKNQSNLTKHKRTHSGEKPYECTLCEYNCCDSSNLRKHILKRHSNNNINKKKLNIDPHPPKTESITNETVAVEKPKSKRKVKPKNLKCSLCEYASSQEIDITRHMRTHTGEKPYTCNLCDYRSIDKGNLAKHMRKHTGEFPFHCNICEYACRDSSNLKKHMRTHTGEKPYQCDICNFKSACPANLNSHMKTHAEEERRFFCTMCDYKSIRAIDLRRHIKTHDKKLNKKIEFNIFNNSVNGCTKINSLQYNSNTGSSVDPAPLIKKEFKCPMCDQTFLSLTDLHTHSESHAGHYLENFKHFLDV